MVCSQCGSPDIQKLSLVYENGLSHISQVTNTAGSIMGVGMARGLGVGAGVTASRGRTSGTQITHTALRAAPPQPKKSFAAFWMVVCGLAAIIVFANGGYAVGLVLSLFAVGAGMTLRKVKAYNDNEYPRLFAYWNGCYLCLRCGTMAPPVAAFRVEQPSVAINVTPATSIETRPSENVPPPPPSISAGEAQ